MSTRKLTLIVPADIVVKARRISKHRKTSVSSMFANYIATLDDTEKTVADLPPMTKRALALASGNNPVSEDWDYRHELADIMQEKYDKK